MHLYRIMISPTSLIVSHSSRRRHVARMIVDDGRMTHRTGARSGVTHSFTHVVLTLEQNWRSRYDTWNTDSSYVKSHEKTGIIVKFEI